MDTQLIMRETQGGGVMSLDAGGLADLLDQAVVVSERDTLISGMIRVLELGGSVLVQEQTPEGQALLRRFASREAADVFVDDRLATYDRMWDGCGCKVRYFE